MRINLQNMLRQAGNAIPPRNDSGSYRFTLSQLAEHLLQLRDRTQAGDLAALDEFFKLYVFDDGKDYVRAPQKNSTPMPITHWSKDPLIPYAGCECPSCVDARAPVSVGVSDGTAAQ